MKITVSCRPTKCQLKDAFYTVAATYTQICTELLATHQRMTHIPGLSLGLCKPTPALTTAVGLIALKNASNWV